MITEKQLRQIIQDEFRDVIDVLSETPQQIQYKCCDRKSCNACIMQQNDVMPWLKRFNIYPTEKTSCSSNGAYFIGHVSDHDKFYNGTTGIDHSSRQHNRFSNKEAGFEDGPKKWCFAAIQSTNNDIKDKLLEDCLIILTRSPMNLTLNLMDTRYPLVRKALLAYLDKHSKLKNIYKSVSFCEWITQTPCTIIEDYPASEIINELLRAIQVGKNQQQIQQIFQQPCSLHRHKEIEMNPNMEAIYETIKSKGSNKNDKIELSKIYRLSIQQNDSNTWMFQHQIQGIFKVCETNCPPCSIMMKFLHSEFKRMDCVLSYSHESHLIVQLTNQIIPGLHYECHGSSRDGKSGFSFHSIVFEKVNVIELKPSIENHLRIQSCNLAAIRFNKNNNKALLAGMRPCFDVASGCKFCTMTGGNNDPALDQLDLMYHRPVFCNDIGIYIEINHTRNFINAGSTTLSY